ncbi:uncharacterized protein LOC109838190 [Asparagus officinalis]|uniref:uncharacterized protein LOC109838190 n=1 Tax=Asparagus officinalis TaxID=4686 RepID=UPI00098E5730|nr:uncharacterized protein LOC109838190 [Asparagus officinalis]
MRWHKEDRIEDGKLRHPADAEAWKHIDKTFPNFAHECRNVRLGLSSDGFNPFRVMSSGWSTWPVVLMPFNLPPLLCMKQPYMILSLLIPGKHAPGNDIDVYLEPLIDELKQLWSEAYANLSGWSTKGKFACPVCGPEFEGLHLPYSRKCCYWFNRRWLPSGHKYRKLSNKFDGTVETRNKPRQMTGADIVKLLEHLPKIRFGKNRYSKYDSLKVRGSGKKKKTLKRKRAFQRAHVDNRVDKLPKGWSKFSIFFQLPYWQKLKIRHNLDVMHIEKNVCDNIVSTLLQDPNKSNDDLRARQDLAALNIREDLQAQDVGLRKKHKPSSHVTMSTEQMQRFCEVLKSVKSPDGYSANISNNVQVQERKLLGLKTHDYHVLLHQLLPVALRNNMEKEASKIIMEYCGFFRKLCSKVIDVKEFKKLETKISLILCNLELIFPPSFFTVMVHVTQHLASEAIIAGPVSYRWMYPIERYLGFMKRLVRNRAHPEGSMAEGYVDKDVLAGAVISEDILVHTQCPYYEVRRYSEHIINGYKFKTVATNDKRLEDIVEIIYGYGKKSQRNYCMFKVRWSPAKPRKDHYGFTLVNLDKEIYLDEKFIFAEQADQCFYVKDPKVAADWVVLYKEPRSIVLPNNNADSDEDNEPIGSSDEIWQMFSYPQNVMLDMTDAEVHADNPILARDREPEADVQLESTTSRRKQATIHLRRAQVINPYFKFKELPWSAYEDIWTELMKYYCLEDYPGA